MLTAEIINRHSFYVSKGCHPRDSLLVVLEGSFNCTLSGKTCTAEKNDIFFFPKNVPFIRKVISPLKCIYIQFSTLPTPLNDGLLYSRDSFRTNNTIVHLVAAINGKNHPLVKHLTDDILLMCSQCTDPRIFPNDETVSACIEYMKKNMESVITLDILAAEFYVSKQWLISKFRKHTGKTPMEYLSAMRISHAKILLSDTDLSIGDIAVKCGFDNVYYFSNTFKKQTGSSPSQFRKKFRL